MSRNQLRTVSFRDRGLRDPRILALAWARPWPWADTIRSRHLASRPAPRAAGARQTLYEQTRAVKKKRLGKFRFETTGPLPKKSNTHRPISQRERARISSAARGMPGGISNEQGPRLTFPAAKSTQKCQLYSCQIFRERKPLCGNVQRLLPCDIFFQNDPKRLRIQE
jgi:hypothetical protein